MMLMKYLDLREMTLLKAEKVKISCMEVVVTIAWTVERMTIRFMAQTAMTP